MHEFDLEKRTFVYSQNVRSFIRKLKKDICTIEDCKQLARSSGSVGANYIEANEAISKKDFVHRLKICRKEAKESKYWLELVECFNNQVLMTERERLVQESLELIKIFNTIIKKNMYEM